MIQSEIRLEPCKSTAAFAVSQLFLVALKNLAKLMLGE